MAQLEELLVDGDELDKDLVASILSRYVRIERHDGAMIPTEGWNSLGSQGQILVFLTTQKARKALGIPAESEDIMPADIEQATGLVGGTVRSALNRLSKRRLIDKKRDGGYFVPNWALQRVRDTLARQGESHE
jgi:hypothetical protein